MRGQPMPRRKNYPQLLKEYEQALKRRRQNGEINEAAQKTYLNDANRVMESLIKASSADEIEAKVKLFYRGYYRNIIKELKAIMEIRP